MSTTTTCNKIILFLLVLGVLMYDCYKFNYIIILHLYILYAYNDLVFEFMVIYFIILHPYVTTLIVLLQKNLI
jgi:hypothetical protein